jgi:hypothetical protein
MAIIYEKTPGELIVMGKRNVTHFPSGLCRIDMTYIGTTANVESHRLALSIASKIPDDDGKPCIDGAYIFPMPKESRREDGFTEFEVSAYGRTSKVVNLESVDPVTVYGNQFSFMIYKVKGSFVVPKLSGLSSDGLDLGGEWTTPTNFSWDLYPGITMVGVTLVSTAPATNPNLMPPPPEQSLTDWLAKPAEIRNAGKSLYDVEFANGLILSVWIEVPFSVIKNRRNFGAFDEIEFETSMKPTKTT